MIGVESYPLNRYLMDQARGRRRDHQHFIYQDSVQFGSPADVFNLIIVDIDADAPFLLTEMRGEVSRDADPEHAVETFPSLRLMLRYGGPGGPAWSQTPVHWHNVLGYRPVPYVFPVPKLVPAGSQLHLTLFYDDDPNEGHAAAITVKVQFAGSKLFRWRAA